MMMKQPFSRRDFFRLALLPVATTAAASILGCRLATADDFASLPPVAGDAVGFVYDNHLHDAVLPKADIEAGLEVTLHIQGQSAHDHEIRLTASQIASIRAGLEVIVTSSNVAGHVHDVVFNRKSHV